MSPRSLQKAFTLTEVLMAAGILAIGFMLIATIFPVGLKLTTMATERTVGSVVANEAVNKIRLYGADPNDQDMGIDFGQLASGMLGNFSDVLENNTLFTDSELLYPSTDSIEDRDKKYSWSALCGLLSNGDVYTVVFVCRKTTTAARYPEPETDYFDPDYGTVISTDGERPVPVKIDLKKISDRIWQIVNSTEIRYINQGSMIIDDQHDLIADTWHSYLVIGRGAVDNDEIELNKDRSWGNPNDIFPVWVVPPAVNSDRYPVVDVCSWPINF